MGPDQFDKQIREQLRGRKIQPRNEAWERLAARLEEDQANRRKPAAIWIGTAVAGLVLLIGIGFVLMNKDGLSPADPAAAKPSESVTQSGESTGVGSFIPQDPETDVQPVAKVQERSGIVNPFHNSRVVPEKLPGKEPMIANTLVTVTEMAPSLGQDTEPVDQPHESLMPEDAMVALAAEGERVTDAELDSLLRKAFADIAKQRTADKLGSVSAESLLAEAEEELDQSFKEQFFDKLKNQFNKVRVALADRNN